MDNTAAVNAIEAEIETLKRDMRLVTTPEQRQPLLERSGALHERAIALKAILAVPVSQIEQRIAQLGADADTSPDAAVRQQHGQLTRELADQVALTRRAALAEVDAQQALNALTEERARALGEELFQRTASPLTPSLCRDGMAALNADLDRPESAAATDAAPGSTPRTLLALLTWLALSWVLLRPLRRALDRAGIRVADRLARREVRFAVSLFAVWSVLLGVLLPTLSALLLLIALQWAALSTLTLALIGITVSAVVLGFFVRAMALAIFQPEHGRWRLWRVGDAAAVLGVRAGNAIALAIALVIGIEAGVLQLDLSPTSQVFLHSALALISVLLIAYALWCLGRMQRREEPEDTAEAQARRGRLALWIGIGWRSACWPCSAHSVTSPSPIGFRNG